MFFIRYWYVRAKLALAPNRYTPAEKVALAHEDIDVAKTIILDQSKHVHLGKPDNSLSNNQIVEILQRIYDEEQPAVDKSSSKFRKSFWGKLNRLNKPQEFPEFTSLIPEYDSNSLETNKKTCESLVEMGLIDLKALQPDYKVKLAKNSEELAKKIFFGSDKSQNPPVVYRTNLQPSHQAEIMAHYYAPVPVAAAVHEEIRIVGTPMEVPQKSFWEKLLYSFMSTKLNDFIARKEQAEQKITAADQAIAMATPVSFTQKKPKKSKSQRQEETEAFNKIKREKENEKAEAMIELYNYLDHLNNLVHKTASRLEICLSILKYSPKSVEFLDKYRNEIVTSLEQTKEFRDEFVTIIKSDEARRLQAGIQLADNKNLMRPTSLYSEVIKLFDSQLQIYLSNNPCEAQLILSKLSINDICDIFQFSNESKYFDNLLQYLSKDRINEILPHMDKLATFLAVVTDEQLSTFLINNYNKINIFDLLNKINSLNDERYGILIQQFCDKLTADQIINMLFTNYKDVNILNFIKNTEKHFKAYTFNAIIKTLFYKYNTAQLLELVNSCGNNSNHLEIMKDYLKIADKSIDTDDITAIKFFMNNTIAAECLNIKLKPESILRAAVQASSNKETQFINVHTTTIIESAAANNTAATYFNSDDILPTLLIGNAMVIDFPLQNIEEARKFFTKDIVASSYSVIDFELDDVNRVKTAKLLNCQPEKLHNAVLLFSDENWKNSFKTRLESHGISVTRWEEINCHHTQPAFHEIKQFAEIMATPKNVVVPLPNPTSLYSIYNRFPAHSLRSTDPFSKAAYESKGIIESVMNLGKVISDKIRNVFGVSQLLNINFGEKSATSKSNGKAKDKKEKSEKSKASASYPIAAAIPSATNGTPSQSMPKNNVSAPTPTLTDLQVKSGSSPQTNATSKPLTDLQKNSSNNADPQAAALKEAIEQLEQLDDTLAALNEVPGANLPSPQPKQTTVPSTPVNASTVRAAVTPDAKQQSVTPTVVTSPPSVSAEGALLRASLKGSPAASPSSTAEIKPLQIPENYNLVKTKKWLKENRKQNDALSIALKHIKDHIIFGFNFKAKDQIKELHNLLEDLTENELASFLLSNGGHGDSNIAASKNAELLYHLSIYNTGILSNKYGKTLLKAAKQNINLASVLLNHNDITADFKEELLGEFNIQQQYQLLDLCWSNDKAKNLIVNRIEQIIRSMKKPSATALSLADSSLAQKLFSKPEIAKKVLREKLVESVLNMGNDFIQINFLQILKLVSSDEKQTKEFFAKYTLTNEDIDKLNLQFDTCYLPLKSNYQTFFNEHDILKQPYSVYKLVFDDNKLAQAARFLNYTNAQLNNAYFLFPNDEFRNQFFKELDNADIKINRDFISLELLKNDPAVQDQILVTGNDKLSIHLGSDECSVIVPFPHSNELILLNKHAKLLKFTEDAKDKFSEKIAAFISNLFKAAQLGSEVVLAIFGNTDSKLDSIEHKRLSLLPPKAQDEFMEKASSVGTRSFRSSNSFGRQSPYKPKPLLPPQPLTHEEVGLRSEEFDKAKTQGTSAAINILMRQTKFNNIQLLEIITQFSDINSDDPKTRSEHQLFVSQLKNPKLWLDPAMVDVYTLALGYKDSRLQNAEQKLQKCLALVIDCKNPLAFVSTAQLDDLINTYIKTFGNIAEDYKVLELNPMTATLKDIKKAFGKLSVSEHPDKHKGEEEKYDAKFKNIGLSYQRLLKIEEAKEKLTNKNLPQENDPNLGDWGSFANGTTQSSLFAPPSSSSASASLNSSISSGLSEKSSSEAPADENNNLRKNKSPPRPGSSNIDDPD